MKCHALAVIVAVFAVNAVAQDADSLLRTADSWTSTEGKTITARFVRMAGDVVTIDRAGAEFTVPVSRLDEASAARARQLGSLSAGGTTLDAWHTWYRPDVFATLPPASEALDRTLLDLNKLSAAIAHATNAARARHGLPALTYSAALRSASLGHSTSMALHGFFSHVDPHTPARRTMSDRLSAAGVSPGACAENISSLGAGGMTYLSYGRAVVDQWLRSPGHRANLLSPRYRFLGCAAHPCGCSHFHLIATQNFADRVPPEADRAVPPTAAYAPPPPPPPPGTARLVNGRASQPTGVPEAVAKAIDAGNQLQTKGYKFGGGRASLEDTGYDCSGAVSYVLIKAGLLDEPRTSAAFATYGEAGPGKWITIHSRPGHVFMTICGLRLDTGGRGGVGPPGPRWNNQLRSGAGWTLRHPPGH